MPGDLIFGNPAVTPFGAPSISTIPFGPKGQHLSPQQIAMLRQQALAMQEPVKDVKSRFGALAHILDAWTANRMLSQANTAEQTGRQSAADALSSLYKPYLAPDAGSPPASAGAAAGGTGVPAPAAAADASAPRGIRNNNPLNIEDGDFAKNQPGYAGSDGRFAKFEDASQGVAAADSLLNVYDRKHGLDTVSGIINRWAPQSDGNDTRAYVADVSSKLGIGPNDPVPASMRPQLIAAMAQHENGVPMAAAAPAPAAAPPSSAPAPQAAAYAPTNPLSSMISAIAGRPMPSPTAPGVPQGAPTQAPPQQTAQASPAGPQGLPQPLTSAAGQMTPAQLSAIISNPYVPEAAKAAALQMIQQRGQPQTMDVEGGKLQYDASGRRVFIPEPKFGTLKIGSTEVPMVSHYDPATKQWNHTPMVPGVQAGGQVAPGSTPQPDLSSVGGILKSERDQAAAKKGAEEGAAGETKYYQGLYGGFSGMATVAAQQKPNIDILRQLLEDKDFKTGTGSTIDQAYRRALATFGIDPGAAAPREVFNQTAPRILADQFSGMKALAAETGEAGARIFKPMLDIEEKSLPSPEDTPEGLRRKVEILDRVGSVQMQLGDAAADYKKEHGSLDAGFEKMARKIIAESRIYGMGEKIPEKKATSGETAAGAPAVGTEDSGFRFKGGNPRQKENWEPVK